MQRTVLITGSTGTLGRELLKRCARDPSFSKVFVLTRGNPGGNPSGNHALPRLDVPEGDPSPGVEAVRGDLRAGSDLGLSRHVLAALRDEVTDILHCAAATRFNLSLEEARAINVAGTCALLRLAGECRSLRQVGCLSTVYVAGRRTGTFTEDDLDNHGVGFVNTYEQSKNEMEQAVRSMMADLPITVYRLSTVIGDSRTGVVSGFNAIHYALRLFYNGLAPMVPGDAGSRVDLVPVDYVADAAHWLFQHRFAPGCTYHLCSGPERSSTLGDLLEATVDAFDGSRPDWHRRGIEKPLIVDRSTYELFVRSVEETGNEVLRRATRAIETFAYQLAYPKAFDTTRAKAALEGSGLEPPAVLDYYPKVVRYCIETNWGAAA